MKFKNNKKQMGEKWGCAPRWQHLSEVMYPTDKITMKLCTPYDLPNESRQPPQLSIQIECCPNTTRNLVITYASKS